MGKLGLIIQGPLISIGEKTGRTAALPRWKIPSEETVRYDCRNNIRAIIDNFGHLFNSIVVSTWKREIRSGDSWRGASLIVSDEAELLNNSFRQMFSTLAGIEHLEASAEVDMAVKIRTDQYIDLVQMAAAIHRYQELPQYTKEVIFVPRIFLDEGKYGIDDFYFAGSVQAMKAFHRSFFAYEGFDFGPQDVHRALWLKYAYVGYRSLLGLPEYAYFPAYQGGYCSETLRAWQCMVQRVFWPLSFACYRTLAWRGEPLSREALERKPLYLFQETVLQNRFENIPRFFRGRRPRFLGIHWRRYREFRRKVLAERLSIQEQLFLGWNTGAAFTVFFLERVGYYATHLHEIPVLVRRKFSRSRKPLH